MPKAEKKEEKVGVFYRIMPSTKKMIEDYCHNETGGPEGQGGPKKEIFFENSVKEYIERRK